MTEKENADAGWDDYSERVVRNEGELNGLKQLVRETRESDRKMIEQRSDSLAQELERRAASLMKLAGDEREADNREHRNALAAYKERNEQTESLLREMYDAAIFENRKQSDEAIKANEEHSIARYEGLRQQVTAWRESGREARELATIETNRRLDALNHADEKRQEFQANAVTRELFNADKEAQTQRETVLRDQIIALDRMMLGMQPATAAEKVHQSMTARMDAAIAAASMTLDTKINVNSDKINELKSSKDMLAGKSQGATVTIGYLIAAATLVISVVVLIANRLT